MTGKDVDPSIIVDIGKIAALQEDVRIANQGGSKLSEGIAGNQFDIVISTSCYQVIDSVFVYISYAHTPFIPCI